MTINNYQRAFDATMNKAGNPDPSRSFKAWQNYAVTVHKNLKTVTDMFEADRADILKTYSQGKATEMLAERQADYMELRKHAEKAVRDSLNAVVESKKAAIRKASKAPSDEDIRLLQALSLRSNLTESDVIHAAEVIGSNLVSLGTLADIAKTHGITLPIPTAERMEEQLDKAARYADDMIKELHEPDNRLSYKATEFYNYADAESGFAVDAFADLDNSVYSAEQMRARIESKKVNMQNVLNPKANGVSVELREGNSIANIAMQFGVKIADIEKVNPGLDIESLHAGDKVIIPSGKMKNINGGAGFASADQITPVEIAPAEG